ncbi:MAG: dihydrofolate reductase [Bacteroidetes bacterium]|nr:dihydrofolate reductase [Bacteroidota bacterium]
MIISIVVAVSCNHAIGKGGDLLWHLPKDMKRFKEITYGHHVLMGRKTYESIPEKFRPLPGRVNIVVSRSQSYAAPGCKVVNTLEEGVLFAQENGEQELMVIGGAEIYKQALGKCNRVYLSLVDAHFAEADAFFPVLEADSWSKVAAEKVIADEKNKYDIDFQILERKPWVSDF